MIEIHEAFERHTRIGFQFSGGRDSLAALYFLRPYWPRMAVYHLNAGDQFPETREVVAHVAREVNLTVINTDSRAVRAAYGNPSDIVPFDNTEVGRVLSGRSTRIQGRMDCCWRSLMEPLHRRMLEDGITLIVRGQRDDEFAMPHPFRSGARDGDVELLHPIQAWSADRVMAYLRENGLPIAAYYYDGATQAPECMGCTAWWNEGRSAFMRHAHPEAFTAVRENMRLIRIEIDRQYATLDDKEHEHG